MPSPGDTLAIGPFEPQDPKTHPKDWILCRRHDGELIILPHGTRVRLTKTENDRDYFEVLDFNELLGTKASLGFSSAGSRLIQPLSYTGPAEVSWNAGTGTVEVRPASGASVTAQATSQPGVPDGTYDIWPKYPAKAMQYAAAYIDRAPHALSWWLIAYQTHRGFCLHTGQNSAGCITVTEIEKWQSIYQILLTARSSDNRFSGKITISG